MQINQQNNVAFGTLYQSYELKQLQKNPKFMKTSGKDLKTITYMIRKNNLNKAKNVDIILNYNNEDKFYGIISSKKQGVPINPAYKCLVSSEKNMFNDFSNWLKDWNDAYSPKTLKIFQKLLKKIKNGNIKQK